MVPLFCEPGSYGDLVSSGRAGREQIEQFRAGLARLPAATQPTAQALLDDLAEILQQCLPGLAGIRSHSRRRPLAAVRQADRLLRLGEISPGR